MKIDIPAAAIPDPVPVNRYTFSLEDAPSDEYARLYELGSSLLVQYLCVGKQTGTETMRGYVIFVRAIPYNEAKQFFGRLTKLDICVTSSYRAMDNVKSACDYCEFGHVPSLYSRDEWANDLAWIAVDDGSQGFGSLYVPDLDSTPSGHLPQRSYTPETLSFASMNMHDDLSDDGVVVD